MFMDDFRLQHCGRSLQTGLASHQSPAICGEASTSFSRSPFVPTVRQSPALAVVIDARQLPGCQSFDVKTRLIAVH
jgi:hypothetical protein